MDERQELIVKEFLEDIKKSLPEVYISMVGCLDEYDGFAPTKMFNQFCELSNKAMRESNEQELRRHLSYMSKKLDTAQDVEFEMIDVYYVESLMWNVNTKESKWAWSMFPENIKALYVKMWGGPRF